jgi:hypothetical protein
MQFSKTPVPPIHTAGTVQSCFEEREGELQNLPWAVRSPDLDIVGPLWSVLKTRARNRFPPPTSVKQLDVLQEEWYEVPLERVQNLYQSIPRRTAPVMKAEGGSTPCQEMCTVSIVFPLVCPAPVYVYIHTCSVFPSINECG